MTPTTALPPLRAWTTIGAPAGHVVEVAGGRVRCSCGWSTSAVDLTGARRAHVRHIELVRLLASATRGAP